LLQVRPWSWRSEVLFWDLEMSASHLVPDKYAM